MENNLDNAEFFDIYAGCILIPDSHQETRYSKLIRVLLKFFFNKSCHYTVKTVPNINTNNFLSPKNLLKVNTQLAQSIF